MKNLRTFESWESGYYPPGTEFDPSAPWNQRDPEYIRGVDMKPGDIKFEVVNSDYREIAVLKDKAEGKFYAMPFDSTDDDFRDYLAVDREYIGRDEDGDPEYEYDWDNVEVDDEAIEKMKHCYSKECKSYFTAEEDPEILNILDEIIALLDKTMYLLTLK